MVCLIKKKRGYFVVTRLVVSTFLIGVCSCVVHACGAPPIMKQKAEEKRRFVTMKEITLHFLAYSQLAQRHPYFLKEYSPDVPYRKTDMIRLQVDFAIRMF